MKYHTIWASSQENTHARIKKKNMGGGGGGTGPTARKQSGQPFFLFFQSSTYLTVDRGDPILLLQRKLYFFKDPEGVLHFPGVQLFPGGSNAYFYMNPYNL